MEEILALTVVIELPHDIGVDDIGVFAFDPAADPWDGWDSASMASMVHYQRELEPGRVPTYRVVLRRTRVRSRLPLQAADKAYGDWVRPLLSPRSRLFRRMTYRAMAAVGLHEWITVAGVTAFIPTRLLPEDLEATWTEARIRAALEVLNEFLVSLGVEANDPRLGPLYRTDLAATVPIIAETQPVPTGRRVGGHFVAPLHDWFPAVLRSDRSMDDLERASSLFRAVREHATPWFPVLDLTHTARRDGMAGRYASAVLGAATAVEVLAATVVTEAGRLRGWNDSRIDGVLGSGFKNLVRDHVPLALGVPVDIHDAETPWGHWWHHGYLPRNAVVHRGHRPSEAEAEAAVYSAMRLVAAVGRTVAEDPALSELTIGLPTAVEKP